MSRESDEISLVTWLQANGLPTTTPETAAPSDGAGRETSAEDDYWNARAQADRDAVVSQQNSLITIMRTYFGENGMGVFADAMEKYVRAGYTGDALFVLIHNDPDYRAAWDTRFAGNIERKKNGLSELLPANYLAMEQGYKQVLLAHGMPKTLFDEPADFAALIGRDVSVTEANDRVQQAADYINYSGNQNVKKQLREVYGLTDSEMIAHVLDPTRTMDYLKSESRRNMNRANVGGAAETVGLSVSDIMRDEIADMYQSTNSSYTSTFSDSTGKFGTVAQESPLFQRLGQLSAVDATGDELIREQFALAGGAEVAEKKKRLASQERARFSGSSGVGRTSLSAGRRAQ